MLESGMNAAAYVPLPPPPPVGAVPVVTVPGERLASPSDTG